MVVMKVDLNEEQVERLLRGISGKDLRENFDGNLRKFREFKERELITEIAEQSGFHPAGYGAWDMVIGKDHKRDVYYAEWKRSDTCD